MGQLTNPCERNGIFPRPMSSSEGDGSGSSGSIALLQKRRVAYWVEGGKISQQYFFAEIVPPHIMSLLQKDTKKVIAGLELLAGVLALYLLGKMHSLCRSFFFVDNEAARACLILMIHPSCLTERCSIF